MIFSEVESWRCKTEEELPPPPCPRLIVLVDNNLGTVHKRRHHPPRGREGGSGRAKDDKDISS